MSDEPNRSAATPGISHKIRQLSIPEAGKPQGGSEIKLSDSNGQAKSSEKEPDLEEGEIPESDGETKGKDKAKSTTPQNFPITQLPNVSMLTTSNEAKYWMEQVQAEVRIKGSRKRFENYPK